MPFLQNPWNWCFLWFQGNLFASFFDLKNSFIVLGSPLTSNLLQSKQAQETQSFILVSVNRSKFCDPHLSHFAGAERNRSIKSSFMFIIHFKLAPFLCRHDREHRIQHTPQHDQGHKKYDYQYKRNI